MPGNILYHENHNEHNTAFLPIEKAIFFYEMLLKNQSVKVIFWLNC